MAESTATRETVAKTLDKYKKNKTMVPSEDLHKKYRRQFSELCDNLRDEVESYLRSILTDGIIILNDDFGMKTVDAINDQLKKDEYGKRVSSAIFKNFDLEEAEKITKEEHKEIMDGIYDYYLTEVSGRGAGPMRIEEVEE